MKRLLPLLALLLAIGYVGSALRPPRNPGELDVVGFGQLPVLVNGRIKPFDTVARTSLLQTQGRQPVATPDGKDLMPMEWLLDVLFRGDVADTYQTFEITHPELLAIFNLSPEDGAGKKRFAANQLSQHLEELDRQAKLAEGVESAARTPFQKAVLRLRNNLILYQRLKFSLVAPNTADFFGELSRFERSISTGIEAVRAKQAGQPHDEAAAALMIEMGQRFIMMERTGYLLAVPPEAGEADLTAWKNVGSTLLQSFETGRVHPIALTYAGFARAWRTSQAEQFNHLTSLYRQSLTNRFSEQLAKAKIETRFNAAEPFYRSSILYGIAFLLGIISWLKWPDALGRSAFWWVAVAFVTTTAGICMRMWLEGRPPVTNLYSSALFVGWGAVGLCLILEAFYKNAIASVAAGLIGGCTLVIAHHLSLSGDTLEMMRAVLDSNFWLATHVVVVTMGYAATFLGGFLALIYVARGVFTTSLDKGTADALARMVYGIVCFATLFSLVGTVLGGIWADQSWGRFWGWDPKENGALIIVIWNAIILHARWGGLVKQRGLMALAIFGNVVTAWSWFGVNMLGVGLHSYGFMDEAFLWLVIFGVTQLAAIGLANIPLAKWRSFAGSAGIPQPKSEVAPVVTR